MVVPQVGRALCLGPLAVLGMLGSAVASCAAIMGDGVLATGKAAFAIGGSLKAFAPVGKAAAMASKEVNPFY